MIFNVSSYARKKVAEKRKKKGLGELKPRENNAYKQIFVFGSATAMSRMIFAPLDRLRFLSQTRHMTIQTETMKRPTGSSISNLSRIISEQGVTALWRGNMANMYR